MTFTNLSTRSLEILSFPDFISQTKPIQIISCCGYQIHLSSAIKKPNSDRLVLIYELNLSAEKKNH